MDRWMTDIAATITPARSDGERIPRAAHFQI
jgi:hypothetical protein